MSKGGYAVFQQDESSATITLHRPARGHMIGNGVISMLRGVMLRHQDAGFHGLIQVGCLMSEGSGKKVQMNIPCPSIDKFTLPLHEIEFGLMELNELPGDADLIVRLRLIAQ